MEDDVDAEHESDDDSPIPKAYLLVRRKLSDEKLQIGKVTNVLVEIYNAGNE